MLPDPESTPPRSKEELQRLLRQSLKAKRPRSFRLAFTGILIVLAVLALLAWRFGPAGEAPRIAVVAFDDVDVAGRAATLTGVLAAPVGSGAVVADKAMVFAVGQDAQAPGLQSKEVPAKTDVAGRALCPWTFLPETTQAEFVLRLSTDKFRPGMEDRGQIVLLPSAARLCLVQIEGTLTSSNAEDWRSGNIRDILPKPGTAEALEEVRTRGYEVVYLALAADEPTLYQKMRAWVQHQSIAGSLPAGAVLSRFTLPPADRDKKPWQQTAERLGSRFASPAAGEQLKHLAMAGTIDAARQFHAARLRTLYLGSGDDLPAGIERLPGWDEVRQIMKK
jgi:hypothetical protein